METIFMNTENSKTNESNKFVYQFTYKLNLKNPNNKNIGLVKSTCSNSKFKVSAPTWNDEFELPGNFYSISDIQDYFEFIIKNTKL